MVSPLFHINPQTGLSALFMYDNHTELTKDGLPRFIQDTYERTLSQAAWFTYDGLWSAAASGIVKGMLAVSAAVILASGGWGLIAGAAEHMASSAGIMAGFGNGLALLTSASTAIPILGAAAAAGALYDVSKRQERVQRDLAQTRSMMANTHNLIREYQLELEQHMEQAQTLAAESPAMHTHTKPEHPPAVATTSHKWQDYVKNRQQAANDQERGMA